MNTNLDTIFKTPWTHSATAVGISKQLLTSFFTAQIAQIKTLFENISNIKCSLLNQNDSIIAETLLFGSNGLNDKENAWIIESTIEYIVTVVMNPLLLWIHCYIIDMNPFKQITSFPEISNWFWITLCHTFQLFSCSIFLYMYFSFNALLNVYHQGYVVCNSFFLKVQSCYLKKLW